MTLSLRLQSQRPREELYDLRKDPHYMVNVATQPDYQRARRELEGRLLATLREQADPRLVESPPRFESFPYGGLSAGAGTVAVGLVGRRGE